MHQKIYLKRELTRRKIKFRKKDNRWQLQKKLGEAKLRSLCDHLDAKFATDEDETNFPMELQKLINDYVGYDRSICHETHNRHDEVYLNEKLYSVFTNEICAPECYMKMREEIQRKKNLIEQGCSIPICGAIDDCFMNREYSLTFKYKTWVFQTLCDVSVRVDFTSPKYKILYKEKDSFVFDVKHIYNSDDHSYRNNIMRGRCPSHMKPLLLWKTYMQIDTNVLLRQIINAKMGKRKFLLQRLRDRIINFPIKMF